MRFIKINGTYYNPNEIASWQDCDDGIAVTLKNGDVLHETGEYAGDYIKGADFIVQIMSPNRPLAVCFKQKDNSIERANVHALALCADGEVRGLVLMNDGFLLGADFEFSNFVGVDDIQDPIFEDFSSE